MSTFNEIVNEDCVADIRCLIRKSAILRENIIKFLHNSGGGHFGGALSVSDILLVLMENFAVINADNVKSKVRDHIILSKGHAAITYYCMLAMSGVIPYDKLKEYGAFNAGMEGHPDMTVTPGVDFSTGSLGQGLSAGIGMAIALQSQGNHVWVIVGDGECQEGQIWEAAAFAERYQIANIHVIVDCNRAQEFGFKHVPHYAQEPLINPQKKWAAFGWEVFNADGHDHQELMKAYQCMLAQTSSPSVLIANTKKGAGVASFESDPERFHCAELDNIQFHRAIKEAKR